VTRQASTDVLRADLADEVRARTSESDALAASAERLRAEVAAQSAALLGGDEAGRAAARSSSGWTCSPAARRCRDRGCGSCSPTRPAAADQVDAAPRGGASDTARISDRNLQDMVNALWQPGPRRSTSTASA
jgi:hypothetical protein